MSDARLSQINNLLNTLRSCPQLPKCPHIMATLDEARGLVRDEIAYRVRIQAEYADFLDSDTDDDSLIDPNENVII